MDKNIVFYRYKKNGNIITEAVALYEDGTENVIDEQTAKKLVREIELEYKKNGQSIDDIIGKKVFVVKSKKEFKERHAEFEISRLNSQIENLLSGFEPIEDEIEEVIDEEVIDDQDEEVIDDQEEEEYVEDEAIEDDDSLKVVNTNPTKKGNAKKTAIKATAAVVTLGLLSGCVGYAFAHEGKTGDMYSKNFGASAVNAADVADESKNVVPASTGENNTETVLSNDEFGDYTYNQLIEVTQSAKQKEFMQNMGRTLDYFNGTFADAYVEEDKNVRAALTWDEVMALKIVYNNYSKEELLEILNGSELDAYNLQEAYGNAFLQLMGAYVIEDPENRLDLSYFIEDEEDLAFVRKYQTLLLNAVTATGEEKNEAVRLFYAELVKDFPLDEIERMEGISHSDYDNTESKKIAIAPMVAAAEIMFQDLDIDLTFADKQIELFTSLGLCNVANKKLERAANISLLSQENDQNPTYEQFKEAKIKELTAKGLYNVYDDTLRDLSKLDKFKERVDHRRLTEGFGFGEGTYIYQVVQKWTETKTTYKHEKHVTKTDDRDEAVKEIGEEKVKEAEDEFEEKLEKKNEEAKKEGEEKAEENKKEMQEEADKNREEQEEEVKKDHGDLEESLDKNNETIDDNNKDEDPTNDNKVNENDFEGEEVHIDKEHKDEENNINDSVKDITLDGTNDESGNDLPDPNATQKDFEARNPVKEEPAPVVEEKHEEPAPKVESAPAPKSNEQLVEEYVEKQAEAQNYEDPAKVLTLE